MNALPTNEPEFWGVFDEADPKRRFGYVVNRPLVALLFLFGAGVLGVASTLTVGLELEGWMIAALWTLSTLVVLAVVFVAFVWRTFARRSGVLMIGPSLVWLDAGRVRSVDLGSVDTDALGRALAGARRTAGQLSFEIGGQTSTLLVYNPFMRIHDFPALMVQILEHVSTDPIDAEGLPEAPPTEGLSEAPAPEDG